MNSLPKILVFDSGAGGLTVAKEITRRTPCHLIYAADNAYFPYGTKNDKALTARIVDQIERLHRTESPDIVVVACNTASTIALDTLRAEFTCPFVGVVPAIKPAAKLSRTGVIGVLATPATVSRDYTQQLIQDFAPDHEVLLVGSDVLVDLAEQKLVSGDSNHHHIWGTLDGLFHTHSRLHLIDVVVLACTHFPLLRNELEHWSREKQIQWIDSGEAIAKRVQFLLDDVERCGNSTFRFSFSDEKKSQGLDEKFLQYLLS